jgi:hypothetical protein
MYPIGHSTTDARSPWERPALASGIISALVQLAAFGYFATAPHMPPLGASAAERAAFYAQHWGTLPVANYLYLLPVPFFLLFVRGLFAALRRAEGGAGVLTVATCGAGIALAMTWPSGIVVAHTGQSMARDGLEPVAVVAFDGVAQHALTLSGFPRAVLLGGAALLLLQAAIGPRWLAWVGLALAAAALVGTATLVLPELYPVAALGAALFDLWLLAISGLLLRRPATAPAEAPAPR